MTSKRSAPLMVLIVWLVLLSAPAGAGPVTTPLAAAQTDSLVWYVEQLEADLQLCRIVGDARADSLALRLETVEERLAWANEDRRRWYQDPRLWFLVGAVSATAVMAGALQVSF